MGILYKTKQTSHIIIVSAIMALVIASCKGKETEEINVSSVSVTPDRLEIIEGESAKLTAKISPAAAADRAVAWTSSDQSVVTVDDNGNVNGHTPGTANVTAAVEGHSATCPVTVKKKGRARHGSRSEAG